VGAERPGRLLAALIVLGAFERQVRGPNQRLVLEIVDDRHQRGSTIFTSQVTVDHWHEVIADPTIADAVLDRLVHNAHRLELKGDSMRKVAAKTSILDAANKP